jgi:hypothetical protein
VIDLRRVSWMLPPAELQSSYSIRKGQSDPKLVTLAWYWAFSLCFLTNEEQREADKEMIVLGNDGSKGTCRSRLPDLVQRHLRLIKMLLLLLSQAVAERDLKQVSSTDL